MIFAHSFIPLINRPTRISKNNATLIDHILTNTFTNEKYLTGIVKTDISDHFPVFLVTLCGSSIVVERSLGERKVRGSTPSYVPGGTALSLFPG